jgi:hypothetical protein
MVHISTNGQSSPGISVCPVIAEKDVASIKKDSSQIGSRGEETADLAAVLTALEAKKAGATRATSVRYSNGICFRWM